jgi:hypothetical protein
MIAASLTGDHPESAIIHHPSSIIVPRQGRAPVFRSGLSRFEQARRRRVVDFKNRREQENLWPTAFM